MALSKKEQRLVQIFHQNAKLKMKLRAATAALGIIAQNSKEPTTQRLAATEFNLLHEFLSSLKEPL
jgi:DNA-dependent RNA polymerase auxiliary subunit epsilon